MGKRARSKRSFVRSTKPSPPVRTEASGRPERGAKREPSSGGSARPASGGGAQTSGNVPGRWPEYPDGSSSY